MSATIYSDDAEGNVLSHIRHDRRLLHSHPWIDQGVRLRGIRRQIKGAIGRVREYRQRGQR